MADLIDRAGPEPDAQPSAPRPESTPPAALDDDGDESAQTLRARYAEIAQLAGQLAHEIRNPLSTMALNLDLLAEEFQAPDNPRDRRVVQKIERLRTQSRRLHDVLESFLRFARVQGLRRETADLNVIVEELRDFFEPQAMSQGIVMRTYCEPDLPRLALDVDLFRQALLNLLINARQAMPEGGELMLRTRSEGAWNVLEVTDTGFGMPPEVQAKVFDAFFSTRPGGSGLGLPTTRKVVEAHGGTIRVESEPGKGSQFVIRLPNQRAAGGRPERD